MSSEDDTAFAVRVPGVRDGRQVHELISTCPPLDENSIYCNLLQCTHLAQTCALAEDRAGVVGFVSAYRLPEAPWNLFVWQIAVAERGRGVGLAKRMLCDILARPACRGVRYIRATVTLDNQRSRAMFDGLAKQLDAPSETTKRFDAAMHFGGRHVSEHEIVIGPFDFSPIKRREVS
ncbi:MAG TPA: diaminobutyrate acetyltransferase [Gammaproteobacteria bacterium]